MLYLVVVQSQLHELFTKITDSSEADVRTFILPDMISDAPICKTFDACDAIEFTKTHCVKHHNG